MVVASCIWSQDASAYCRTAVCTTQANQQVAGTICVPADAFDCGIPLAWPGRCVGYALDAKGSSQVPFATIESLVQAAFTTWNKANCNGSSPGIEASYLGEVNCNKVEYDKVEGNANVITFRDEVWPHEGAANTLGLTTVTYNLDSGQIFDADMEINSTNASKLTTGNDDVENDLLSILTHEAGHFLGLAHSPTIPATMFAEYLPGDTHLRDLDPDDVSGICATYPSDRTGSCDTTPRHGFDEECFSSTDDGCNCTVVGESSNTPPSRWPLALLLTGLFAITTRRRSSRQTRLGLSR